jgi:hypothetical protein
MLTGSTSCTLHLMFRSCAKEIIHTCRKVKASPPTIPRRGLGRPDGEATGCRRPSGCLTIAAAHLGPELKHCLPDEERSAPFHPRFHDHLIINDE